MSKTVWFAEVNQESKAACSACKDLTWPRPGWISSKGNYLTSDPNEAKWWETREQAVAFSCQTHVRHWHLDATEHMFLEREAPPDFKSPLDADIAKYGPRWGFLVNFVRAALGYQNFKHMSMAAPYFHNREGALTTFDESCIRCNLEEALKHVEREGWDGSEWKGEVRRS